VMMMMHSSSELDSSSVCMALLKITSPESFLLESHLAFS
jgi:hypothetical protein